jgi:hypothetical protein
MTFFLRKMMKMYLQKVRSRKKTLKKTVFLLAS